jgi:uncharacterized repeat protein (TIGR03803 family)
MRKVSAVLAVCIVGLLSSPICAQTYTDLYNFGTNTSDPSQPNHSGLIAQGRDGNLYSTAPYGGTHSCGAVFKMTPAGKLTVLYNFTCGADGANPFGGLTLVQTETSTVQLSMRALAVPARSSK